MTETLRAEFGIELIKKLLTDHETNYVQRDDSKWDWSCSCGESDWFYDRESAVKRTREHWADKIFKAFQAGRESASKGVADCRLSNCEQHPRPQSHIDALKALDEVCIELAEAEKAASKGEGQELARLLAEINHLANDGSVHDFTVAEIRAGLRDALYAFQHAPSSPGSEREADGWVKFSDRLPPAGPKNPHNTSPMKYFCLHDTGRIVWEVVWLNDWESYGFTHWAEVRLPAPPRSETEGKA